MDIPGGHSSQDSSTDPIVQELVQKLMRDDYSVDMKDGPSSNVASSNGGGMSHEEDNTDDDESDEN